MLKRVFLEKHHRISVLTVLHCIDTLTREMQIRRSGHIWQTDG